MFKSTEILIYIISLSDYDEINLELDENRMIDALETFDGVMKGELFKSTPIILFWNKKERLEQKISEKDLLSKTFPQYKGGQNPQSALEFIQSLFRSKIPEERKKFITEMMGNAIYEDDVANIFKVVQDITVKIKLNK